VSLSWRYASQPGPAEIGTVLAEIAEAQCGPDMEHPVGLSAGRFDRFDDFAGAVSPIILEGCPVELRAAINTQCKAIRASLRVPFVMHKQGLSTCGMWAEQGVYGRLFWDAPWLYRPIEWSKPVSRAIGTFCLQRAWFYADKITRDTCLRPGPGCYVVVGCRNRDPRGGYLEQYGGIEHARVVIRWIDDELVETADAGQVDAGGSPPGLQCVKRCRSRWVVRACKPWMVDPSAPAEKAPGRRVLGWGYPSRIKLLEGMGAWLPTARA